MSWTCPKCGEPAGRRYGPYEERKRMLIFPYYVYFHEAEEDGEEASRCWVPAGPSKPVAPDSIHVEAELPWKLVDDVVGALAYARKFSMGRQRIVKPLERLVRRLGLQRHTEEEAFENAKRE